MATTKLHQAQLMSAAWRIVEPLARTNPKVLMKRYGLSERQLKKAVNDLLQGNFKKSSRWNPAWDHPETIHHPVDSVVMTDIENGSNKGSDFDLLMDPDFDSVNGMCHFRWTEADVLTLCEGLPYRILEILRDATPGDDLYQEAVAFMDSDLFNHICAAFGLDRDYLLENALSITKADM